MKVLIKKVYQKLEREWLKTAYRHAIGTPKYDTTQK